MAKRRNKILDYCCTYLQISKAYIAEPKLTQRKPLPAGKGDGEMRPGSVEEEGRCRTWKGVGSPDPARKGLPAWCRLGSIKEEDAAAINGREGRCLVGSVHEDANLLSPRTPPRCTSRRGLTFREAPRYCRVHPQGRHRGTLRRCRRAVPCAAAPVPSASSALIRTPR